MEHLFGPFNTYWPFHLILGASDGIFKPNYNQKLMPKKKEICRPEQEQNHDPKKLQLKNF